MSKVYVGDTGTAIILNCGQDISAATAWSVEVRKPNGELVSWAASASGSDSIRVTTTSQMLTLPGRWLLQAKVTLPSGVWRGETAVLEVFPAFA